MENKIQHIRQPIERLILKLGTSDKRDIIRQELTKKLQPREIEVFVALEGFEPSLKVPETCVLPLHHKAKQSTLLV